MEKAETEISMVAAETETCHDGVMLAFAGRKLGRYPARRDQESKDYPQDGKPQLVSRLSASAFEL